MSFRDRLALNYESFIERFAAFAEFGAGDAWFSLER